MNDIKEFNLLDVRKNSQIVNTLNKVYKLWGYEKISPSMISNINVLKTSGVINPDELVSLISNNSLCLRPEMTTSIVKLISTRLINKKRPIRLWNNGVIFEKKNGIKNSQRFNERIQSGIELIGYDTEFPEIEVINILFDSIDKLNLKRNCNLIFLVSSTTIMDLILNKYKNNNYEEIKKSMINFDQDNLNKIDISPQDKEILNDLLYTRGDPIKVIDKLSKLFGDSKVLNDLQYLFNTIIPIAKKYQIKIQLDPTFQPHLNLYEGMVFQLISEKDGDKTIIAKGGRYDELVRFFNPKERVPNGLGFSISIDNLRGVIKEENNINNKLLLLYQNKKDLPLAIEEQKKLHEKGIVTILEINPCRDILTSENLMKENNCSEIKWIK